MNDNLKHRTAGALKWNLLDKLTTQVIYAVTGIVLARLLSVNDFGLVGAVLVFQAFGNLLVDSGFSYALLQRRQPTQTDYSTVLWFNMTMAVLMYLILFFCAPLIARWFGDDMRIIPVARVLGVAMILNASYIVQFNILTKQMNIRPIYISNTIAGVIAGGMAIWAALAGWGVWAIVLQTLLLGLIKTVLYFLFNNWLPSLKFSLGSLRSFFGLGMSMMTTSFLNTVFQNLYGFFIGNRVSVTALGYYAQSDKWSKMGISSLSQTLTSSLLPTLSHVQDDPERFRRVAIKSLRLAAYILFPAALGLCMCAAPLFQMLFGNKWDASILLFQLLLIRGIFTVLNSVSGNFFIALGYGKDMVRQEIVRDSAAVIALIITLPYMGWSSWFSPVSGVALMLVGQVLASFITWVYTVCVTSRRTGISVFQQIKALLPYALLAVIMLPVMWLGSWLGTGAAGQFFLMIAAGGIFYCTVCALSHSVIQKDIWQYAMASFRSSKNN